MSVRSWPGRECGGHRPVPRGYAMGLVWAAVTAGVPLNLVQKWLGHAQLSTTAIYADAVGEEEHAIAARMWRGQARAPPRATRTARIRDVHAGPAPTWALLCPVKARASARVLTNAGLHTAGVGELVWREKAIALRWSASGSPRRASHPPLSDLCSALTLCGMGYQRAS